MPIKKYRIAAKVPALSPQVYLTCLTCVDYRAPRYWDGERWWGIDTIRGNTAKEFKWPKAARTTLPNWMKGHKLFLRSITDQAKVNLVETTVWYEDKEVLRALEVAGILHKDWRTKYQNVAKGHFEALAAARKGGY